MMPDDTFVSVVACLADDADIVASFVDETAAVLAAHYTHWELVLVDDGSTDGTVAAVDALLARHPSCRLLRLSRRFGEEIAIAAGLETAIGDFVAVVAPATDPPALLPEMIERCRDGAGIVSGTRLERHGEPALLRWGARAFYALANRAFHLDIPANSTHFKVLSRQAVNAIIQVRDRNRFLRTLGSQIGFVAGTFPYHTIARRTPPRRKTVRQGLGLAANIIVTNSVQPLYLAARIGLFVVAANAAFLLYVIAVYTFKTDVEPGWTTGSAVMATMFGTTALMGTIGLTYLARLVEERSDRPLYFVLSERSGSVPDLDRHRNVVADSEGRR
jgi:glycosyltransferase involved in cell wall biosynthesis